MAALLQSHCHQSRQQKVKAPIAKFRPARSPSTHVLDLRSAPPTLRPVEPNLCRPWSMRLHGRYIVQIQSPAVQKTRRGAFQPKAEFASCTGVPGLFPRMTEVATYLRSLDSS